MVTIRVWHDNPRGDAYYYRFSSMKSAQAHARKSKTAQEPLIYHKGKVYTPSSFKRVKKSLIKKRKRRRGGRFGGGLIERLKGW